MNSSLTQDIYSFFSFSSSESPIFARLVGAPCQRGSSSSARAGGDWPEPPKFLRTENGAF